MVGKRWVGVLLVVVGWGTAPGLRAESLDNLVERLGAEAFRERRDAEEQLKKVSRDALPALRGLRNATDDPEIRLRLERVIEHVLSDPRSIPRSYRAVKPMKLEAMRGLDKTFRDRATLAAHNTGGNAGSGGALAQSFLPGCKTVAGLELFLYPRHDGFGWLRVDLCRDKDGAPGYILARSWLRIPREHPFTTYEYIYFDIPDQQVDPDATYWMTFVGFPDPGSESQLNNYGLSFQCDDYPAGMLWRATNTAPQTTEDLKFRVFGAVDGEHPGYREATPEEKQGLSELHEKKHWKTQP